VGADDTVESANESPTVQFCSQLFLLRIKLKIINIG